MDLQALRKSLLEQVEEAFPAETDAYRDIRNQSTQVSLEIGVVPVVLSVPSAFTGWLFQLEVFLEIVSWRFAYVFFLPRSLAGLYRHQTFFRTVI